MSLYFISLPGSNLKPNSITLAGSKLVADRFEAGRRPASNLSAISFEPASVMEFGFYCASLNFEVSESIVLF